MRNIKRLFGAVVFFAVSVMASAQNDSILFEDNTHIRLWRECGISADNAADTQSLIQLHNRYCERKDCLRCRFGYYSMKKI